MTEWVDFRRGAGLRVDWHCAVLVLRNQKEEKKPWTVIHLNDEGMDGYYVGRTLTDSHVEDWQRLTYLMS